MIVMMIVAEVIVLCSQRFLVDFGQHKTRKSMGSGNKYRGYLTLKVPYKYTEPVALHCNAPNAVGHLFLTYNFVRCARRVPGWF